MRSFCRWPQPCGLHGRLTFDTRDWPRVTDTDRKYQKTYTCVLTAKIEQGRGRETTTGKKLYLNTGTSNTSGVSHRSPAAGWANSSRWGEKAGNWTVNRVQAPAVTGSGRETTPEGRGRTPMPPTILACLEKSLLTGYLFWYQEKERLEGFEFETSKRRDTKEYHIHSSAASRADRYKIHGRLKPTITRDFKKAGKDQSSDSPEVVF